MGQLSRESQLTTISRSTQTNVQMATLQAEYDRLMLAYTDQHPDVVRVRNQMRDLQSQSRRGSRSGGLSVLPGQTPTMNPVYQQLRTQLAEVRRQGAASASRLATAQALLRDELERSRKILGDEGKVTALTRAQEVNKEMYEDLLKRRENARVSMSLDADGRSLGFQIQEPATVPLLPTGLRLMHFAAAGLLLAIAVPLLLLSLLVKHDPRARSPDLFPARRDRRQRTGALRAADRAAGIGFGERSCARERPGRDRGGVARSRGRRRGRGDVHRRAVRVALAVALSVATLGCGIPRWPVDAPMSSDFGLRMRGLSPRTASPASPHRAVSAGSSALFAISYFRRRRRSWPGVTPSATGRRSCDN